MVTLTPDPSPAKEKGRERGDFKTRPRSREIRFITPSKRGRGVDSVGGPIGWGDIGYGVVETGAGQETLRVVEPGMVVIDGRARNSTHREGDS
jgi:hypothetical protein